MNKLVTGKSVAAAEADTTETKGVPSVKVAYHDGPPHIGFYGRRWARGVAQEIPAADWEAMQARSDCAPFDFRVVS